jgi:hypothetical protein
LPLIPSTVLVPHHRSHYSSISEAGIGPIVLPEVHISRSVIARVVRVCRGSSRRVRVGLRLRVGFLRIE